jgi:hypothetical protein
MSSAKPDPGDEAILFAHPWNTPYLPALVHLRRLLTLPFHRALFPPLRLLLVFRHPEIVLIELLPAACAGNINESDARQPRLPVRSCGNVDLALLRVDEAAGASVLVLAARVQRLVCLKSFLHAEAMADLIQALAALAVAQARLSRSKARNTEGREAFGWS